MSRISLVSSDRIYRASDLNRRGREVLTTARASGARIVDTDGTALVMVEEGVLDRALERLGVAEIQIAAMRAWRELAGDRDVTADLMRWANRLHPDDRAILAQELADSLDEAARTGDARELLQMLREWEKTSELPYDQELVDRLAAGFDPSEYIEVLRPTDDEP